MLLPKRVKYRKQMRGRMTGATKGGATLPDTTLPSAAFGDKLAEIFPSHSEDAPPDISLRESGRVVDAIAHHEHIRHPLA